MFRFTPLASLAAAALLITSCGPAPQENASTAQPAPAAEQITAAPAALASFGAAVNTERLLAYDNEPGSWMSVGRDYGEQRYSPLDQINVENVSQLSLVWSGDMDTSRCPGRGLGGREPGPRQRGRRSP